MGFLKSRAWDEDLTVSSLLQILGSEGVGRIRMKKERHKRATEVTTVVSRYLTLLGPPEKCSEHFLELLSTTETGHWSIYPLDSKPYWLRVVLMGSSSTMPLEGAGSPYRIFSGRNSNESSMRLRWDAVTVRWVWACTELATTAATAIRNGRRERGSRHHGYLLYWPRSFHSCYVSFWSLSASFLFLWQP